MRRDDSPGCGCSTSAEAAGTPPWTRCSAVLSEAPGAPEAAIARSGGAVAPPLRALAERRDPGPHRHDVARAGQGSRPRARTAGGCSGPTSSRRCAAARRATVACRRARFRHASATRLARIRRGRASRAARAAPKTAGDGTGIAASVGGARCEGAHHATQGPRSRESALARGEVVAVDPVVPFARRKSSVVKLEQTLSIGGCSAPLPLR